MVMSLQRFMDGVFEGIWDTKDFKTDKFIAWDIGSEIVINRNFFHQGIEFVEAPVNIAHHKDFVHDDNQNYRNKKARPG